MTEESKMNIENTAACIARQEVALDELGNKLAKIEGYDGIKGFDAINLYLIKKYHWKPSYVKQMPIDDISLILNTEQKEYANWKEEDSIPQTFNPEGLR